MTTKAIISKKISKNINISFQDSLNITNTFINLIIDKSKKRKVKINGFGTFFTQQSPERNGRNPKTKQSYIIPKMLKLILRPSNKIKKILN